MNALETAIRQILRDESRSVLDELLPGVQRFKTSILSEHEDSLLISTREAAKRLAISESTLFKLTKSGQLPCVRVGMSKRYSVDALRKWITESVDVPAASLGGQRRRAVLMNATPERRRLRKTQLSTQRSTAKRSQSTLKAHNQADQDTNIRRKRRKEDAPTHPLTPFSLLLAEIGVDRADLPAVTNGELKRIAEVDKETIHSWQYHHRPLPEEAAEKLRAHFRRYKRLE
jgi:excisionase family DNA binding protein